MIPILLTTYGAVLMAEIVGDKLLYTTGVLATRYRTTPILFGMALAFALKMGVAVLVGHAISMLPKWLVAAITAINFFAIALAVWRKPDRREVKREYPPYRAALVAFSAIFFSEWGDVGQLTAATLAARFQYPLAVWLGAVAAMVTKGALVSFIGAGLRGWIQAHFAPRALRYAASALLALLGILSVSEILFEH